MIKNLLAVQETRVQFLGLEDPPGEVNGYLFQYSCLGNPTDRGAKLQSMELQRIGGSREQRDQRTENRTFLSSDTRRQWTVRFVLYMIKEKN